MRSALVVSRERSRTRATRKVPRRPRRSKSSPFRAAGGSTWTRRVARPDALASERFEGFEGLRRVLRRREPDAPRRLPRDTKLRRTRSAHNPRPTPRRRVAAYPANETPRRRSFGCRGQTEINARFCASCARWPRWGAFCDTDGKYESSPIVGARRLAPAARGGWAAPRWTNVRGREVAALEMRVRSLEEPRERLLVDLAGATAALNDDATTRRARRRDVAERAPAPREPAAVAAPAATAGSLRPGTWRTRPRARARDRRAPARVAAVTRPGTRPRARAAVHQQPKPTGASRARRRQRGAALLGEHRDARRAARGLPVSSYVWDCLRGETTSRLRFFSVRGGRTRTRMGAKNRKNRKHRKHRGRGGLPRTTPCRRAGGRRRRDFARWPAPRRSRCWRRIAGWKPRKPSPPPPRAEQAASSPAARRHAGRAAAARHPAHRRLRRSARRWRPSGARRPLGDRGARRGQASPLTRREASLRRRARDADDGPRARARGCSGVRAALREEELGAVRLARSEAEETPARGGGRASGAPSAALCASAGALRDARDVAAKLKLRATHWVGLVACHR